MRLFQNASHNLLQQLAKWLSHLAWYLVVGASVSSCSLLFSGTADLPRDAGADMRPDATPFGDDSGISASCPPTYTESFGDSGYRFGTVALTWYQAEQTCEGEGAHLAVIDSKQEADFLGMAGFVGWIGASDHVVEGDFAWVTGPALSGTYERWGPDEPNDQFMAQDCVRISSGGFLWDDGNCETPLAYVCECDGLQSLGAWCRTGTDTDCDTCGHDCLELMCSSNFCSF